MLCAAQIGKDIDGVICDLGKNPETGNYSIAAENKGSLGVVLLTTYYYYLLLTTIHYNGLISINVRELKSVAATVSFNY